MHCHRGNRSDKYCEEARVRSSCGGGGVFLSVSPAVGGRRGGRGGGPCWPSIVSSPRSSEPPPARSCGSDPLQSGVCGCHAVVEEEMPGI